MKKIIRVTIFVFAICIAATSAVFYFYGVMWAAFSLSASLMLTIITFFGYIYYSFRKFISAKTVVKSDWDTMGA